MRNFRGMALAAGLLLAASGCGVASDKLAAKAPAANDKPAAVRAPGGAANSRSSGSSARSAVAATPADLASVAQATKQLNSGRFEMTSSFAGSDAADFKVTGAFDINAKAMSMILAGTGQGMSLNLEVRVVDGAVYMQVGDLGGIAGGKKWIKVPDVGGSAAASMSGSFMADPAVLLDQLKSLSGAVETVGHETIDGVGTVHYRATVDLAKVASEHADELLPGSAQEFKDSLAQSAADGSMPIDLWVGDDGYVHQVRLGFSAKSAAESGSVTVRFFDLGAKVDVAAPPANETADAGDALNGLLGGLDSLTTD